ncbi:sulfite oxidase [Fodinicurvata sp. EGI_FJ10296]|uniref:sulfite oxidase n=1 Tax=Fodinicurvata sp. EGI_FJ10296 TaxID=3231908 RepID=UPI0034564F61
MPDDIQSRDPRTNFADAYSEGIEAGDRRLWGRIAHSDRRGFLRGAGLSAMGLAIGASIPFHRSMPAGLIPAAFAQIPEMDAFGQYDGLTLLNERPLNAETPPHLLDDAITPNDRMFIRSNGLIPDNQSDDVVENWRLIIDGEVDNPLELSIADLQNDFDVHTVALHVECGGNGRAFFNPGASGNQWTFGAVGCPEWTGVRLRDVLERAGVRDSAVYTGHYGNDPHISGDTERDAISRGVPIEKAMDPTVMIVWAMNGGDMPQPNGHPLRLVVPGWPGSCSQKFLTRIQVRDQVHDGEKMGGYSYRMPAYPVAPGTEVPESDMEIMEAMPVKSIITFPETGTETAAGEATEIRGHAWVGDAEVSALDVSIDFGQSWQAAELDDPVNPGAWQNWRTTVTLPEAGYYEVWARATDSNGRMQPPVIPGWNPRGYGNNMSHRIAIFAA